MTRFTAKYVSIKIECTSNEDETKLFDYNDQNEDVFTAPDSRNLKVLDRYDVNRERLVHGDADDVVTVSTSIMIQFAGSQFVDGK